MLRQRAPFALVAVWLAVVTVGLALAALKATEPPVWDALSYVQKAFTFWQAVAQGHSFDPFALPMTVRPPGTVLMSYPLGWSAHFQWFYFRSSFIPVVLLLAAVMISAQPKNPAGRWVTAALAITLAGMPILFQFQANDVMPSAVNWGLVDGFIGGVAALAAAAVVRSVDQRSLGWATLAALAGAFCVLIKPAGFIVMGLTGLSWVIVLGFALDWNVRRLADDLRERWYAVAGFAIALPIFVLTALVALRSAYFSADNVAFGMRVLGFFGTEFVTAFSLRTMARLTQVSFGYVVPLIILIGLVVAARTRSSRGAAVAALVCVLGGGWFWLFETDASQIRYFLPFGVMAFVFVVPTLVRAAHQGKHTALYAVAVVPTLIITALLSMSAPPNGWQRIMGVNLHTNDYGAEVVQAEDLLRRLDNEGPAHRSIYLVDTSPALRNLQAVFDYAKIVSNNARGIDAHIPVNWQTATTTDLEEILRSDYIAFELRHETAPHDVSDFTGEVKAIGGWLSDLTPEGGVEIISDTRVRIVRLADRARFEAAFAQLVAQHSWPKSFSLANPQRWWSEADLAARITPEKRALHSADGTEPRVWLYGAETTAAPGGGLQLSVWLEIPDAEKLGPEWRIFAHVVGAKDAILANAEAPLMMAPAPSPDKPIRYYRVAYPAIPPGAQAVAFGLLKANGAKLDFLSTDTGARDWDGRRIIVPLPASR